MATVAASVTHQSVSVSDSAALTRWVTNRYPTEVEMVPTVRPAWLTGFLQRASPSGDVVADPSTGEVVPGLAVRPGGEFAGVTVRATSTAKEVFAALASTGLRRLAVEAGPNVPVVLAELADADA